MEPLSPRLEAAVARLDARIDWERRDRGALRLDLSPMGDLARRLSYPQRAWRAVHVGGTKGKGSVASLVAAGLGHAGLRTGTYGSPHVERVTERVRIGMGEVPDDGLAEGIEAALQACGEAQEEGTAGARATWFDLMTAAAFWAFRAARVDWAVVEVGLGGRLDSTNVIQPEVCVVTNVDLEHTDVLGSTRAAIAAEKAGILEPGAAFVCGERPAPGRGWRDDAGAVLAARARELSIVPRHPAPADTIAGANLALARAALDALGERGLVGAAGERLGGHLLEERAVVACARLPGRLERASLGEVPVVLDGAHVPSSLRAVLGDLGRDPRLQGPCAAVLALARDKDAQGLLKALGEGVDSIHCTSVASGIHLSAAELTERAHGLGLPALGADPAEAALRQAVAAAGTGGWVLVTGSLYLVGAVRGLVETGRVVQPPRCSPSPPTSS